MQTAFWCKELESIPAAKEEEKRKQNEKTQNTGPSLPSTYLLKINIKFTTPGIPRIVSIQKANFLFSFCL